MRGFTLIEFIIYLALVAAIVGVAAAFSWQVIEVNAKAQAQREVQQNGRFVMEKVSRIIESASGINSPVAGSGSSSFSLKMSDSTLDPTLVRLNSETIQLKRGNNDWIDLTNQRIRVTDFQVRNLSYENTPGILEIKLSLANMNSSNKKSYEASLDLRSSFSLYSQGQSDTSSGGSCQGTAISCDSLTEETNCQNQDGCSWAQASCTGTVNCLGYNNPSQCNDCSLCGWSKASCNNQGSSDCSGLTETECSDCNDCSLAAATCSGTAVACEDYSFESNCNSQEGCSWISQ